jgi:type I site-specific restriction endonuclease
MEKIIWEIKYQFILIVRGQLSVRKTVKSAYIVLYYKPNIPLAVIEAKVNKHEVGKGMQRGLDYARLLDVPFVFASNGNGFIFHDATIREGNPHSIANSIETEIKLEEGVTVKKIAERVQYYDTDGKLVTESFKDYTRNTIRQQFASLDDFTKRWQDAEKKQVIIDELAEYGVIWEALEQDVSKEMDPFILSVILFMINRLLPRKERAILVKDGVKKFNYFTKYSETEQKVQL